MRVLRVCHPCRQLAMLRVVSEVFLRVGKPSPEVQQAEEKADAAGTSMPTCFCS